VNLGRMEDNQRSCIAPIIRGIIDRSAVFLFTLVYANRSYNHVAHVLAKQVSDDTRVGEWQSAPPYVLHLFTKYCNPSIL